MARVVWNIGGRTGHGEWVAAADAQAWAAAMNALYGGGSHWIEWQGAPS